MVITKDNRQEAQITLFLTPMSIHEHRSRGGCFGGDSASSATGLVQGGAVKGVTGHNAAFMNVAAASVNRGTDS